MLAKVQRKNTGVLITKFQFRCKVRLSENYSDDCWHFRTGFAIPAEYQARS